LAFVLSRLLVQEIPGDNLDQILFDYIQAIKKMGEKARLEDLLVQLAAADRAGDTERVTRLSREINNTMMKSEGPERGVAT
jgi:DNA primase